MYGCVVLSTWEYKTASPIYSLCTVHVYHTVLQCSFLFIYLFVTLLSTYFSYCILCNTVHLQYFHDRGNFFVGLYRVSILLFKFYMLPEGLVPGLVTKRKEECCWNMQSVFYFVWIFIKLHLERDYWRTSCHINLSYIKRQISIKSNNWRYL